MLQGTVVFHAISRSDVRKELQEQSISPTEKLVDEIMEHLEVMAQLEVDEGVREEWAIDTITEALDEIESDD